MFVKLKLNKHLVDANALFVFSLCPIRIIDKTHLHRIIFFIFLSNLRVKLPITKTIENNIFEDMLRIRSICLNTLNIVSKQFKHN